MRVVVIGASGNAGTSLLAALARDPDVEEVVGVARRIPEMSFPKTSWRRADVTVTDLAPLLAGADAVVHLAWSIQPSRDERARAVSLAGAAHRRRRARLVRTRKGALR